MIHVHNSAIAAAPVEIAFAYIDDYRNVGEWMFGVSKFVPVGEKDQGLGAVFDGSVNLGPKTLHSTVEVTGWEQDKLVSLKSIKGFKNTSTWHFASAGGDQTELTVDFYYEFPGGLAGRALARVIEPFIIVAIRHTEQSLRHKIEAHYAQQRAAGS